MKMTLEQIKATIVEMAMKHRVEAAEYGANNVATAISEVMYKNQSVLSDDDFAVLAGAASFLIVQAAGE